MPTTTLKSCTEPSRGTLLDLLTVRAQESLRQMLTWIGEQGVCYAGLNEAFEVTLPSFPAVYLLCDCPIQHPQMPKCTAPSGPSLNTEG